MNTEQREEMQRFVKDQYNVLMEKFEVMAEEKKEAMPHLRVYLLEVTAVLSLITFLNYMAAEYKRAPNEVLHNLLHGVLGTLRRNK